MEEWVNDEVDHENKHNLIEEKNKKLNNEDEFIIEVDDKE